MNYLVIDQMSKFPVTILGMEILTFHSLSPGAIHQTSEHVHYTFKIRRISRERHQFADTHAGNDGQSQNLNLAFLCFYSVHTLQCTVLYCCSSVFSAML